MKLCKQCNEKKPLSNFYKYKPSKDGYQYKCKQCMIEISKNYYRKNKEIIINRSKEYAKTIRLNVLKLFDTKCKKCGFTDVRALQIDHINGGGIKEINRKTIKSMHSYYKRILNMTDEERNKKYQCLCANCNWIKRVENKEYFKKL